MTRAFAFLVACILLLLLAIAPARAGCDIVGVQSVWPPVISVGAYRATSAPPATSILATLVINMQGNGVGSCQGAFGLVRTSAPALLSRSPQSGATFPYTVTSSGVSVLSFGGTATAVRALPAVNAPNGSTTATLTALVTIASQAPATMPVTGIYQDHLTFQIFDVKGNKSTLAGQVPITVDLNVLSSCMIAAPGAVSLNFSTDVAKGIPAGAVKSTSFNVNCTSPSRVQLSGSALTILPAGGASGAFDTLINYRAVARFGGATATLMTSGTVPVTSMSPSQSTVSGTTMPVGLDVNLIAGRPLIGGATYSGVLKVTVDPAL